MLSVQREKAFNYWENIFITEERKGRWALPEEFDDAVFNVNDSKKRGMGLLKAVPLYLGTRALKAFLKGDLSFNLVPPFYIPKTAGDQESVYTLGRVLPESSSSFILAGDINDAIKRSGLVVVLPQEDSTNTWLDFYEPKNEQTIHLDDPVKSYRVNREAQKIETRNWHGSTREIFLSYLAGESIALNQLGEFNSRISETGSLSIGMAGNDHVGIYNLPEVYSGQEVKCRPFYDARLDYSWLEGFVDNADGTEEQIFNRRTYKGDTTLHVWRGRELQSLIDWILGKKPFALAEQVRLDISEREHLLLLNTAEAYIRIQTSKLAVQNFEQAILKPEKIDKVECVGIYGIDQLGNPSSSRGYLYQVTRELRSKLHSYIPTGDGEYKQRRSKEYWKNPDNVRKELREFYGQTGELSQSVLVKGGRSDILLGIRLYPGGMIALKNELGIPHKGGKKWIPERTLEEAKEFYLLFGVISQSVLLNNGRADLIGAIRTYPGQLAGLKRDIGVSNHAQSIDSLQRDTDLSYPLELISRDEKKELLDKFAELIKADPGISMSLFDFAKDYLKVEGGVE